MKSLLLRGGLLVATLLTASVAYYLAADLAIALAVALAVAMLAFAFVATPVSLASGANSRRSFLVPILTASSLAFGAIGAAISDAPFDSVLRSWTDGYECLPGSQHGIQLSATLTRGSPRMTSRGNANATLSY